jgi:hypothetical protein
MGNAEEDREEEDKEDRGEIVCSKPRNPKS